MLIRNRTTPKFIPIWGDHLNNGWNWLRLLGRDKAAVEYVVQVPRHTQLTGVHSVDGRVKIDGVAGAITATTVDGEMNIENAANDLKLNAVDGKISVSMDTLGAGQSVSLHTVDGGITLAVPENADAIFSVQTIDGDVSSEFSELQPNKESVVGHKLNGKLRAGSAEVAAATVDGSVHIGRNRAAKPTSASSSPQLFYTWRGTNWVAEDNHDFSVDSPPVFAAKKLLALADDGNYSESWKQTALFDWMNLLNTNRVTLGKLISRQLIASIPLTVSNGVPTSPAISDPITSRSHEAPDGPYVFVQFESSFAEKKNAKEEIMVALEKDGQWRPCEYFIK